jgi:hypothetical protein
MTIEAKDVITEVVESNTAADITLERIKLFAAERGLLSNETWKKSKKRNLLRRKALFFEESNAQVLTHEEQVAKKEMYCDLILTIHDSEQDFWRGYIPICSSEAEQIDLLMFFVTQMLVRRNTALTHLIKISSAMNWNAFTEVTLNKSNYVFACNGKWFFNADDKKLDSVEKYYALQYGFGTVRYVNALAA